VKVSEEESWGNGKSGVAFWGTTLRSIDQFSWPPKIAGPSGKPIEEKKIPESAQWKENALKF